eukprot:COSAG04_NODE_280_length_18201_cov_5.871119_5_plen_201_part_00
MGEASYTVTDTFYDGGHSSTGIFSYCCTTMFYINGGGPDAPNAVWTSTSQRTDYVDNAAWTPAAPSSLHMPPLGLVRLNTNRLDSTLAEFSSPTTGPANDYITSNIMSLGTNLWERNRFERNGNMLADSIGKGGVWITAAPRGDPVPPRFEFSSSEWVGNAAGAGPGIYVMYSDLDLVLRQCIFRCAQPWIHVSVLILRN